MVTLPLWQYVAMLIIIILLIACVIRLRKQHDNLAEDLEEATSLCQTLQIAHMSAQMNIQQKETHPMHVYLANALSLNMTDPDDESVSFTRTRLTPKKAADYLKKSTFHVLNRIGHPDTATVVASQLAEYGYTAPEAKREDVTLKQGDVVYVAQYTGPRLPEGATHLPEGAKIIWYRVVVTRVTGPAQR
jgi:hypothetical protein